MFKDTKDTSEPSPTTGESEATSAENRPTAKSEGGRKKAKPKLKKADPPAVNSLSAADPAMEAPRAGFDYSRLKPEIRAKVQGLAKEINDGFRRTGLQVFELGKQLLEMKDHLGHGQFGRWLETEFAGSRETATAWMKIAKTFDGKPELLESVSVAGLSVLARLDGDIREQIIELIKAKRIVTAVEIEEAAREAAAAQRVIDAPEVTTGREPVEARRPANAKKAVASAQTSADVYDENKIQALKRSLLDVVRPQVDAVTGGIEAVSLCLGEAVDTEAGGTEMRVGDLRDKVETMAPTLYRLTGTDPETEAGRMPRLAGVWREIEQALRAVRNALSDAGMARAARDAIVREAHSKLGELLN
jgi:hypothetical protein